MTYMLFDRNIHKNINIVALDLDSTLTQHVQTFEEKNRKSLELLSKEIQDPYVWGMRIRNQLGKMKIVRDLSFASDHQNAENFFDEVKEFFNSYTRLYR